MADIMTIEQMQKGSLNLDTLEAWVEGAPNTTITTPNGRVVPTMSTAVANLTTDGIMQDNKTQRQINTEINTKVNSVSGGYFKAFDTLANLQAVTGMTTGQVAKVMNDPTAANNGDYRYTGSAWVKGYDALTDARNYTDTTAMPKPKRITVATDLNTLTTAGSYLTNAPSLATLANNYPVEGGLGVLAITASSGTSFLVQHYRLNSGVEYIRTYNGTTWVAWQIAYDATKLGLNDIYEPKATSFIDRGLLNTTHLDTVKTIGVYVQTSSTNGDTPNGYPVRGAGFLEVIKSASSSIITQRYTTTANKLYLRYWNNSVWTAWIEVGAVTLPTFTNYAKIVDKYPVDLDADTVKAEFAYYLVNSNTLDLAVTKLPIQSFGVFVAYKSTATSFTVQQFIGASGDVYTRYWDGTTWKPWVGNQSSLSSINTLSYSKTATSLTFKVPSVNDSNKIGHRFDRRIDANINLDSWGMTTATEYTKSGAFVRNLTTAGVWEVAILDSQNAGDHSGGSHGDEVLNLAYFIVDGIYKPQDFVGSGKAKEIKHVQHSTIYVEGQATPICRRETTWTFTANGNNCKTKLIFDSVRTLIATRLAMLPVLRKANQDNTGEQITDTEIRSYDDLVVNVAEPNFTLRDLPMTDGQVIILSGTTSGLSAKTTVNKITAPDAHAFVQNTINYNKLYIDASVDGVSLTTKAGDTMYIDVDFVVKTIN